MNSSFERLLDQIDSFIRKFYKNEIVKGLFFFVGILLFSFLLTTSLEYLGRFSSLTRAILFFSFVGVNLLILFKYILIPLSRLYAFGARINRYQASEIIGNFFPEISDRLKNTLQLQDAIQNNERNIELLNASVQQRSVQLTTIPFASAIDISDNKKYLKYIAPLVLVLMAIGIFIPSLLTQGAERVVNYDKEFKIEAPFSFNVNSENLKVEEGEDVPIELTLKGNFLPDKVYMVCENGRFLMERKSKNVFKSFIRKPKSSSNFYFVANEYQSDPFKISVTGKSVVGKMEAQLNYPAYLNKENEMIQNAGDLVVPEGTEIIWNVITKNTKKVDIKWKGKVWYASEFGFRVSDKFKENSKLKFSLTNRFTSKIDSVSTSITVINDSYPSIYVSETVDSTAKGLRLFKGQLEDDYGLKSCYFVYEVKSENGQKRENRLLVRSLSTTQAQFDFGVDFSREDLKLKDKIEYYFIVYDNDGVNGSKSTRSQTYTYQLPTLAELNDQREVDQEKTKEDLNDVLKKTEDFQKKVEKLKKEAMNSKSSDWNKMNQVNQLQEEQKNLVEKLQDIKEQMDQSTQDKNQLSEMDKELLEKQEMIEKLIEDLMDDELRKLLDDLEKLLEKNDKQELKEKMEQLDQSTEDMKKQLDRSLEMLKRLQVNEKVDDIEKELKDLAKEQEELKKDIEDKKISKDEGSKKQEELNKKFDDLKKDLNDLKELNKDLANPMELGDTKEQENKISEDMKDSKESLDGGKDKKAGEKQKSAADEMKKMADELDKNQKKSNKKQDEEDIDSLRAILESLMILSFDQEENMNRFSRVNLNDPSYTKLGKRQRRIIDDTKIVKDSLLALAKRQPKIASFVDKELNTLESNHKKSIEAIDDHKKKELAKYQQIVMTSYNNLALLLNEALQSMQSQMQSEKEGSGSCDKPGKGRPKPGSQMSNQDMKEMLKKQLEQMQKGPNPGGDNPGDKPGEKLGDKPGGKPGNSGQSMLGLGNKEIAKMAAEQTAIRQKLEQMRNELNKEGKGLGNKLNPLIKELEEQERSLINKSINRETINRQRDILTRLLESEKALLERGFEEKRESKSGKDINNGNKIIFEEYNKEKLKHVDLLRSIDPNYRKYFKDKANQYFNQN